MYNLPTTVDPNKVFLIKRSELEGRIDAAYIAQKLKTKRKYNYPTEKLNKLVRSLTGGTPSKEKPEYWDGDIYWVSPKDFKQFYINKSEDTITELGLNNSSTKLIPANSILIVVRSGVLIHTLPVAINTIPVTINQDIKALIPTNKILPEYLGYYFNVFNSAILPLIVKHSTTVQSVNTNEFDRLEIPVPPIKDQQLIVNILNCALSAKQQKEAEAKALLASIDAYLLGELGISLPEQDNSLKKRIFIARFSEVGGGRFDPFYNDNYFSILNERIRSSKYNCRRLKEVNSFLESGSRPTGGVSNIPEGILSFGGEHVNERCEIEVQKPKYIPIEFHEKIKNTETKLLDIILVKDGATTGKIGIIENFEFENQNINEHVFMIRANNLISPYYLVYFLHSQAGQIQIQRVITGATVTGLTKDVVQNLIIPFPPFEKQSEIANHIQNIRRQAKALQHEAARVLEEAKREVEKMILGE